MEESTKYLCDVCLLSFSTEDELKQHRPTHKESLGGRSSILKKSWNVLVYIHKHYTIEFKNNLLVRFWSCVNFTFKRILSEYQLLTEENIVNRFLCEYVILLILYLVSFHFGTELFFCILLIN